MAYLTDRKRADRTGSAKAGTEHHWNVTITSVALVLLVPLFVFTFGAILGRPYEEVLAYYARPFPAIVAALTFLVGFVHFRQGAQVLIEDYAKGFTRKALILGMICLSYAAAAVGVFAVARIAL